MYLGPHRRVGRRGRAVRQSGPSLHPGPAVGRADGSPCGGQAAHRAERRDPQRHRAAGGMPVRPPMPRRDGQVQRAGARVQRDRTGTLGRLLPQRLRMSAQSDTVSVAESASMIRLAFVGKGGRRQVDDRGHLRPPAGPPRPACARARLRPHAGVCPTPWEWGWTTIPYPTTWWSPGLREGPAGCCGPVWAPTTSWTGTRRGAPTVCATCSSATSGAP